MNFRSTPGKAPYHRNLLGGDWPPSIISIMATRVFLLSADEKAVHVITQILDEQDIRFEHSSDPTFTLKRLAGQHFDVLVVDCANAESAMQVFNSARASSLNKGAIAIAIVEGKAGVPNAFRLGASLVLTKPVSLDQARNTLRTAVGMTKKDAAEARPMVMPPAPAPPSALVHVAAPAPAPVVSVPTVISAPPVVAAPPVVSAPPAPITPAPSAPMMSTPASPAVSPAPVPVATAPQVIAPKPPETPAPTKTPGLSIPAPQSPASPAPVAAAFKEAVVPEKLALTPVAVKPQPILQLGETRVVKVDEDAKPAISLEKTSSSTAEKSPLSLSSAMLGSTVSDAAIDKLETELAPPTESSRKAKTFEMFAPVPKPVDDSALEPIDDEPEDSAAALRASAVPAFGGLAKQPFAGIETEQGGGGLLIGGLVAAVVVGGFAAAWFYAPGFQKTATWEYSRIHDRVFNSQAAAVAVTVQSHPAPALQSAAPVQATTSEQPTSPTSIDPPAVAGPAAAGTVASTTPQAMPLKAPAATAPTAAPASSQSANVAPAKNPPATTPAPTSPATSTGNASLMNASATTQPVSASAKPAELFEVPEDYADDQVVRRVHPIYPKGARVKKLQGTVVLQAIIDKQGKVDSLQMVSGDPLLAQAAADAVKQWRYKPYSHNGDPVEFQTRVTVDFKLP